MNLLSFPLTNFHPAMNRNKIICQTIYLFYWRSLRSAFWDEKKCVLYLIIVRIPRYISFLDKYVYICDNVILFNQVSHVQNPFVFPLSKSIGYELNSTTEWFGEINGEQFIGTSAVIASHLSYHSCNKVFQKNCNVFSPIYNKSNQKIQL